jgi:single-stranded DNA-binding protein
MLSELGRLVFDVKVEYVGDEKKPVLNNRLAIQLGKDKTTFIDVVAWDKVAETICKNFKKGYEIFIENGHLINKTRKKDNVEFETVALYIDKIKFTNGNPKEFTGEIAGDSFL